MGNRLDFNNLPVSWSFSYKPNIVEKPFGTTPEINTASFQPIIKGTIQQMAIICKDDVDLLISQLYNPSAPLQLRCPIFYRDMLVQEFYNDGIISLSVYSKYDPISKYIYFYKQINNLTNLTSQLVYTGYNFKNFSLTGTNSNNGVIINPALPIEFLLTIRPVDRNLEYNQPQPNLPFEDRPINFIVVPPV